MKGKDNAYVNPLKSNKIRPIKIITEAIKLITFPFIKYVVIIV